MLPTDAPTVEMRGITVSFPSGKALDDVSLRLFPGEVHALMGENGAGKSTLIKALTGVYPLDAGEVLVAGEPLRFHGTAEAQQAGIAVVYQEVNLCLNLSIGESVMLGHEVRGRLGINWAATHRAAHRALAAFGLDHLDTRRPLSSLSLALQQLVAICRAMSVDARVLILDEPTSSLDANEVERLFDVMRRLRQRGVAILFVSHFLDQVYEISDRLTVLRNGRYEGEYATDSLDRSALIAKMIGKDLEALRSIRADRTYDHVDGAPVLVADGIGRHGAVQPMDLELRRGEIVGLAGLLGSGRTELARLLCGADRTETGTLHIRGKRVRLKEPADGLRHKIAFSSENRRDEGVLGDLTVGENLVLAVQAARGWARPLPRREYDEIVTRYITQLGIRPADPDAPIRTLSGGNQQKVLLGRWLATRPDVLLLDEPTRGIDVGAKAEIQACIAELRDSGVTVVFISSEIEEVVRLSDRIVVLRDHSKIAELTIDPSVAADTIVALIAAERDAA
jgi:monosaccharide-transporting ATPase